MEKSDVAERLLSLTIALSSTRHGVLKRDLFRAIKGYVDSKAAGATTDALEKQFERDKDALRELGIEIEIIEEDDDNQLSRYRLVKSSFEWPKDFYPDAEEMTLLNLAGSVWQQAAFSADTAKALDRIRAHGDLADDAASFGYAPKISTHDQAFRPISRALTERQTISFSYRKADGSISQRKVQPWTLSNQAGQWMVTGWDSTVAEENKTRNFLLKRIVSDLVIHTDQTFDKPGAEVLDAARAALQAHIDGNLAEVKVRRDSLAASHFGLSQGGKADWLNHEFNFMDAGLLADELREYALDIQVVAPAELVKLYKEGFERLAAEHG
jgi:proteasome accessory factor B